MAYDRQYTDQEMLDALKNGEERAFAWLYDRFSEPLIRYAAKLVPDPLDVQDVVQDIFVSLWQRRETLAIETSLSAYLFRSVRYRVINLHEKARIRHDFVAQLQVALDNHAYDADALIAEKELRERLDRQASRLPENMRNAFYLCHRDGLSNEEIAAQLALSVRTVDNLLSKAAQVLKRTILLFPCFFMV